MQLIEVSVKDSAKLLEIYAPYIKTPITFETVCPTLSEYTVRIEEISKSYPYLALIDNQGQYAGFAYAHQFFSRAAYQWIVESSIYLKAEYRHQGLGLKLYQALMNLLKLQHIQTVYALITGSNQGSLDFHRYCGFKECGRLDRSGFKDNKWHDVVIMQKRLMDSVSDPLPLVNIHDLNPEVKAEILRKAVV